MSDVAKRRAKRTSDAWRGRIGAALRRGREARGYTQSQLANLIGVDIATISNTERGQRVPAFSAIESMADALRISIDDLVGRHQALPTLGFSEIASTHPPTAGAESRDTWTVFAALQAQLDALRAYGEETRRRIEALEPKPGRKGPRTG